MLDEKLAPLLCLSILLLFTSCQHRYATWEGKTLCSLSSRQSISRFTKSSLAQLSPHEIQQPTISGFQNDFNHVQLAMKGHRHGYGLDVDEFKHTSFEFTGAPGSQKLSTVEARVVEERLVLLKQHLISILRDIDHCYVNRWNELVFTLPASFSELGCLHLAASRPQKLRRVIQYNYLLETCPNLPFARREAQRRDR